MEKPEVKKALAKMEENRAANLLKKLRGNNKSVLGEDADMASKDVKNPVNIKEINDSYRTHPDRPSSTSPERAEAERRTNKVAESIAKRMAAEAILRANNRKK